MMQPELFDYVPPHPQSILGDRKGSTFDRLRDGMRLNGQACRVWDVMADGKWYSLREIAAVTDDPEASISARIRDFRASGFGGFKVESTCVKRGLWRYKLVLE